MSTSVLAGEPYAAPTPLGGSVGCEAVVVGAAGAVVVGRGKVEDEAVGSMTELVAGG